MTKTVPSFIYLPRILNPPLYLFDSGKPSPGEHQYIGPHFLAVISYARKLASTNNDATFFDGLGSLADSAPVWELLGLSKVTFRQKLLSLMASSLIENRYFFAVPKLHQNSLDITPNTVDIVASFIDFLVDFLERLSSSTSCSWIIIPSQIDNLCKNLKFLLSILRDTPFQCTELEEIKNMLAKMESIVNEAGMFLYSFFFTADDITMTTMDVELSLLLSKLEVVEEKIKGHCVTLFEQQKFTTPNLTSASMFVVDSLLDDLNHLLNQNNTLSVQVKDQITTLHDKLYLSRSMLRDIELHKNKELIEYEMQLIDLSYQVEYIIAYFAIGEVPIWYLAFKLTYFIKRSIPLWASLEQIKVNRDIRSIQLAQSSIETSSPKVASKSIPVVDEIIVGFEDAIRQLSDQLFGGQNTLQIISIIGMGGLGKTTLARKLYNHSNALLHFDRRAWCVVSQTYDKRKLLLDVLSSVAGLNKNEISSMEDHELAGRVYKSLKETRYLLVLDDIWKKEVWDYDLKRYFPNDRNGSRILFTSRNKHVALQTSSEPIVHELSLLSADECWDLLQKKVFLNSICPQELQVIGKEIARDCKGLPLAVVGIAAVLSNMDNKEISWQEVATNLTSYISKDKDILELSYEHLPSHLKPCFLYLGVFEEDEEISVRRLFSLWVSNGFIPKNEQKIQEGVAEDYLQELINRSMIQVSKRRSDNGVKTFTMHDLIHDICVRLADKQNFVNKKFSSYVQHQHICSYYDPYDLTSRSIGLHIRSLTDSWDLSPNITSILKRLRVLKISNPEINCDGSSLKFLVQLRHLESDECLLKFWSHMNLEFLSIKEPRERHIQLNMPKLRHLHLGQYFRLKKLDITHTNSLQTLSVVMIKNLEDEKRLRCFSNLRHLKCRYEENREERSFDFRSFTQLVSLNISIPYSIECKTINWPIHIKKLSISFAVLSCGLLSSIGTLPHLEILKLDGVRFEEKRWNTDDEGFQTLKFLRLNYVSLKEWNTSHDHFPVLEQLVLNICWELDFLPSELGYIPSLQRIEVDHCGKSVRNSAKHIKEEQEEEGNELLHVNIYGTHWMD